MSVKRTRQVHAGLDVLERRFLELLPGIRVVPAFTFRSEDPGFAGEMAMAWNLAAATGGTRVHVVAKSDASSRANDVQFEAEGHGHANVQSGSPRMTLLRYSIPREL
jgi:hypothetical protein